MMVNVIPWLFAPLSALCAKSSDSIYAVRVLTFILVHVIESTFKGTSVLQGAINPSVDRSTILNAGGDLTIHHHTPTIREL